MLTERYVRELIFELIEKLEDIYSNDSGYVVWGAKHEISVQDDYCICVLGETVGFIPNPVLRSELIEDFGRSGDFQKEWYVDAEHGHVEHRMGIRFAIAGPRKTWRPRASTILITPTETGIDSAVMHPRLEDTMLPLMADRAYRLYCDVIGERPCRSQARVGEPLFN